MSEHNFEGFIAPKKNFFQMPNCWIDICADITNLAEMKIVQYVLRHTWGYHEYGIKKTITTDEFMHGRKRTDGSRMDKGTGLSNRSVIDGLRSAIQHGYLEVDVDETDRARKCKSYALKMVEPDVKNLHIQHNHRCEEPSYPSPTIDVKNLHIGYEEPSYQPEESSHRSEKDTRERHLKKEREEERCVDAEPKSASADDPHVSSLPQKKQEVSQEALLEVPASPPDMTGSWSNEQVVRYAEYCNKEVYRPTERKRQLKAASDIHKDDPQVAMEQYKAAYDERNDLWWQETQGKLHVIHMKGKEKSGIDRLHAMLDRIKSRESKRPSVAPQPPPPPIPLKPMKSRLVQELDEKRERYARKKG